MNNVLELKGKRFIQANKDGSGGGPAINGKVIVSEEKMIQLANKLHQIKMFWKTQKRPFPGLLISVHYNKIAAKSNRISGLLREKIPIFQWLVSNLIKKKRGILLHIT